MGEIVYVPVYSTCHQGPAIERIWGKNKNTLGWWQNNSILPIDRLLVSVFYGIDSMPTRKDLDVRDGVLILGDSGGYQLYNLGEKDKQLYDTIRSQLNPLKTLRWYEENCQIGMTLDMPLKAFGYSRKKFEKNMIESKANADLMRSRQENDNLKLFNVIHGRCLEDIQEWYKFTNTDYEFDGFSLSGSSTLEMNALLTGFALDSLQKYDYHLLGVSSPKMVLAFAYANSFVDNNIYFDSSSFIMQGINRRYMSPYDVYGATLFLKEREDSKKIKKLSCTCPICSNVTIDDMLKKSFLISLHNLNCMDKFVDFVKQIAHDREQIREFGSFYLKPDEMWIFDFFDMVVSDGIDVAHRKYYMKGNQKMEKWL